jgi:hypothetical protein
MHILFIMKPRLIVIYTLTLYREATPNRDLHILFIVRKRLTVIYAHALYQITIRRGLAIKSLCIDHD